MFFVETLPTGYQDPWNATLNERLLKLSNAKVRIAYIYEAADNSTFRYRAYNPTRQIPPESGFAASYFFASEIDTICRHIGFIHILIVCRCRYTHQLADLVILCRQKGIPVVYDIDDLVFDSSLVHGIVDTLAQDLSHPGVWDHWFAYVSRMGAAIDLADHVIGTNAYLLSAMQSRTNKGGHIVPNFLNEEQLHYSDAIFRGKKASGFRRSNQFHIGYFSGTPSHANDFAIAKPGLVRLMEARDDVCLLIVGYLDVADLQSRFGGRIIKYPLHDFVNLQRLISLVEVNIVPLQSNIFTNAKSELKFFEAAIVGTLTLASPTHSYANSVQHRETGFLVEDCQWFDMLSDVVENFENYKSILPLARDYCLSRYSGNRITDHLVDVFESIMCRNGDKLSMFTDKTRGVLRTDLLPENAVV